MASQSIPQILANAAAAAGVPLALFTAQAQQESGLNPAAYNAKSGATGLLQLEPVTAASLGVTNSLDPVQNANAGAQYLAQLYNRFGSWDEALAAYDMGPTALASLEAQYGNNWYDYAPAETQNYVDSILSASGMDATPALTPASVATGLYNTITGQPADASAPADGSDDTGDDGTLLPASLSPGGTSTESILLLTALGVGGYLLLRDLMDWA